MILGDKFNTERLVGVGLIIVLIMAVIYGEKELAMSIGSGLVGYMGGKSDHKSQIGGGQ